MMWLLLCVCLLSSLPTIHAITASVYLDSNGTFYLKQGILDKERAIAYGSFVDEIDKTGWSHLDVRAGYGHSSVNDLSLMYAAGYLEGAMTARRVYENYHNLWAFWTKAAKTNATVVKELRKFMEDQFSWMKMMISNSPDEPFWRHVGLIHRQFEGLLDGYSAYCSPGQELDELDFQLINAFPDLQDVLQAIVPDMAPKWDEMTLDEIRRRVAVSGHCSALIKVTPGFEDILVGHSTWSMYVAMLRVFKHYSFNLKEPSTGARHLSFSSYPGMLFSVDDYYVLGSGMIVMETTNDIYNNTLYKLVKPESLLSWQRMRTASQIARDATEWTDAFSQYNSGTYNNQYMVLDLNKVKLKESIDNNALRVAEQIPGLVVSADLTPILREGYFASYNVPIFEKIYDISGYPGFVAKYGVGFSHQLAPRAEIFRRDQNKVVDVEALGTLLRYNNYENEEYANHDPCNTICCRGDLESKPDISGCIDTKVTNFSLALSRVTHGISGPTTEGGLPAFSFAGPFEGIPHRGLPTTWDFPFVVLKPDELLD